MVRSAGLNRRNDPPLQLLRSRGVVMNFSLLKRSLFVRALGAAAVVVGLAQPETLALRSYGAGLHEVRVKCGAQGPIKALVYVSKFSGSHKKIDVVVYNHGYGTTASGAIAMLA